MMGEPGKLPPRPQADPLVNQKEASALLTLCLRWIPGQKERGKQQAQAGSVAQERSGPFRESSADTAITPMQGNSSPTADHRPGARPWALGGSGASKSGRTGACPQAAP